MAKRPKKTPPRWAGRRRPHTRRHLARCSLPAAKCAAAELFADCRRLPTAHRPAGLHGLPLPPLISMIGDCFCRVRTIEPLPGSSTCEQLQRPSADMQGTHAGYWPPPGERLLVFAANDYLDFLGHPEVITLRHRGNVAVWVWLPAPPPWYADTSFSTRASNQRSLISRARKT